MACLLAASTALWGRRLPREVLVREEALKRRYIGTGDRILSGGPMVLGTRTSVRAVAELWRLGLQPEEVVRRLPHVTPAQVFDALGYYSEYRDGINHYIERNRIGEEATDPLVRGI